MCLSRSNVFLTSFSFFFNTTVYILIVDIPTTHIMKLNFETKISSNYILNEVIYKLISALFCIIL